MAFLDRSQFVEAPTRAFAARGKEVFAGILLVALIAAVAIRNLVPVDALAPAIVTLLFALAALTGSLALLCRRNGLRTMWIDLAGSLTFVGVVLSVLIEPDQMVRLFALSDQPE
jgi:peptidoglycan/LPS O-acetylase OafA/YrhL